MKHQTGFALTFLLLALTWGMEAQVSAKLFQYPDVSDEHIAFTYGDDIWIAAKSGGMATKLSSPPGAEIFPKFSPDGSQIAFTGNYSGNSDIYVIPTKGGMPHRVTHHGMDERILGWSADGSKLLFASARESGRQRYRELYTVSHNGGLPDKLPVPYGEFGALSPDGLWLAYTPRTRGFRTWKRYRGGMASNIVLFNLETYESKTITPSQANDEIPMWHGDDIYFLSDRGSNARNNIYKYNLTSGETNQVTRFKDDDVHFPSVGPNDLIFEVGGDLYVMDLKTDSYKEVNIEVITDNITIYPKEVEAGENMQSAFISPDGKRVAVSARGEIFSVPAENGHVKNLTRSSGIAERHPSWSPNGKFVAYWSDKSGEYELTLLDLEKNEEKKVSNFGAGYRYSMYWSPDSKRIAFIDQTLKINVFNRETGSTDIVDKALWLTHGGLSAFRVSWAPDSKWISYSRGSSNRAGTIMLFNVEDKTLVQLTSGYYSDSNPVFDPGGKYLYFTTNRTFSPSYSDLDNSFIYPNTTNIAAASLQRDIPSPLAPRNDEVTISEENEEEEGKDEKSGEEVDETAEVPEKDEGVSIDTEGFERRVVLLPIDPGNFGTLAAAKGKVIFHRVPNTGANGGDRPIKYFDLKEREEKIIIGNAGYFQLSANGNKMLVGQRRNLAVIDIAPGQKMDKQLSLGDMDMTVNPRDEWKQIFNDAWRFQRDFFYDNTMHGVDWERMREHYGALIDDAVTRTDVNFIIGELIGELNASHTYRSGGDNETANRRNTGYLGVDWEVDQGKYKIKRIVKSADWDVEARSPLDLPGVTVEEGDYILAVNGEPLDITKDPWSAFDGLAGKTVELTVSDSPNGDDARNIDVELMRSEVRLRHLEWIESNRKRVEEATGGRVGYIYVRSTGRDGQNELVRQFSAQWDKDALIIDERFNSGGQIPDRFIELLDRKPLAFWDVRDGETWQWPPIANFGPKVMLINGWSGSGGDAFPDYFRKAGLGELIGKRTWGGLIGVSGAPSLIDGGSVTVPTFRMFHPNGEWFAEGHGVEPDIEVEDDPTAMAKGVDPQLEKSIQVILEKLKTHPPKPKSPKKKGRV